MLHFTVVMLQTRNSDCVVVGRAIMTAAAFLRGARRLKSRLQPKMTAPQGNGIKRMQASNPFLWPACRANQMLRVLLIFLADVLHQLVIRHQAVRCVDRKWLLIRAGIVDRDLLAQSA